MQPESCPLSEERHIRQNSCIYEHTSKPHPPPPPPRITGIRWAWFGRISVYTTLLFGIWSSLKIVSDTLV